MKKIVTGLLLGCFVFCQGLQAAQIRLAPTDDLDEVLENVRAGDEVILQNGTWHDRTLRLEAEGTAEQPVTMRAETPGEVILTGESKLQFSGQYITVSGLLFRELTTREDVIQFRTHSERLANQCRVTECAIIDETEPPERYGQKWVSMYGTHNRVDHCYFAGKRTDETTLVVWVTDTENHHQIDHNHFGHRPPLGRNGGETIRVGTSDVSMSDSYTIVERNLFQQCDGEGEIISSKSCENIYRDNTFLSCSGALTLRHGNRCLVERNYFLGSKVRGSGGVRIIGEDHTVINNYFADLEGDSSRSAISFVNGIVDSKPYEYFQVKNAIVAFNTIVDCKVAMEIGIGAGKKQPLAPTNCIVAHNVMIGRRNEIRKQAEPVDWQEAGMMRVTSPDELRYSEGTDGIWRPQPNSPVVGAADTLWTDVDLDIDDQPRTKPLDAGCDQQATPPRPPLTAGDVGPSWLAPSDR